MKKLFSCAAAAAVLGAPVGLASSAEAAPKPTEYQNCTALNKVYPHGVGRKNAKDHTSGTPVRNFTRNNAVYSLNAKSDRDKDGIACEKA